MRRRDFIALVSGVAACERRARSKLSVRRLAFLMSASESDKGYQSLVATFREIYLLNKKREGALQRVFDP